MAQELSSHILKATINKFVKENKIHGIDLTNISHVQLAELIAQEEQGISSSSLSSSVLSNLNDQEKLQLQSALMCTRDHLLSGIHVIRAHDQTDLLAAVHYLPYRIQDNNKIKLVIIDSIAFQFRHEEKGNIKARLLANITQTLNNICFDHGVACVVSNHVTTHVDKVCMYDIYIYIYIYVWSYVSIYDSVYIYVYIYIYIYMYLYLYTYTSTRYG